MGRKSRFCRTGACAGIMLLGLGCGDSSTQGAAPSNDAGTAPETAPPDEVPDVDAGAAPIDAAPQPDNGAPSDTYPAFHPDVPQITSLGGPVIASPVFVPITFEGDPMRADIERFLTKVGASTYWSTVTHEYGAGAGKSGTPIHLTETPPTKTSWTDIETWLTAKLDGTHPEWPAPDENTIYVINYPAGTEIHLDPYGASCKGFGGYHNEVQLPNGKSAIYAVLPRCGAEQGMSALDNLTFSMSHELIEASTDPLTQTNPAYAQPDQDHTVWSLVPLAEVGDMCSYRWAPVLHPTDIGYAVQRTWSNVAAKAGHDPCVPAIAGEPYFNAAPVLDEKVEISTYPTKGIKIAVGESKTIDVDLFSDGKTKGSMLVRAMDAAEVSGGEKTLKLQLDRTTGVNGEKLHLTITPLKAGEYGGSEFILLTTLGDTANFWAGWVQN